MNCTVCRQSKRLTKEHTIPHGLLRRLEALPQSPRPNLVWTPQMSKIATDDNHTVKDMCEDCQQAFGKSYDNRVDEAFNALMDLQEMRPPGSITVEEPWFTLYLLRIFWNLTRASKVIVLDSELTAPIIQYATNPDSKIEISGNFCLGISCFPSRTHRNDAGGSFNTVFYAGMSPDKRLGFEKIRVKQLYMRLIGLRFLYMQVAGRHSHDARISNYYQEAVKGKNGVLLQPNSNGKVHYKFVALDPDVTDERIPKIVRKIIGG